jgi:hypothetical protein
LEGRGEWWGGEGVTGRDPVRLVGRERPGVGKGLVSKRVS